MLIKTVAITGKLKKEALDLVMAWYINKQPLF